MKSSLLIWHLLSKCKIEGEDFVIFVASLENMNFKGKQYHWWEKIGQLNVWTSCYQK